MHIADEALGALLLGGPVDLHLHSSASDGTDSPAELAAQAVSGGLRTIALTDHDTLSGIPAAREAVERMALHLHGVQFVPGIEISVQEDRELHLLGYFPLGGQEGLEPFLAEQREKRLVRNTAMMAALRSLGVDVTQSELDEEGEEVVGRLHAARLLVKKGVVGSIREAFDRYLSYGRPAYVERDRPDAAQGCRAIRAAGGVPVLAHPILYGWLDDADRTDGIPALLLRRLAEMKAVGLGGVESRHGEADDRQARVVAAAARRLGLLATRGSDYHGRNKPGVAMYAASTGKAWPEGTSRRPTLQVAAAIVRRTDASGRTCVLMARRSGDRPLSGLWEFPGGKLERGETVADCLKRELREELGVESQVSGLFTKVEHAYGDRTVRLACYETELPRLDGFELTAHSEIRWVPVGELASLPLCPADYPVSAELVRRFG